MPLAVENNLPVPNPFAASENDTAGHTRAVRTLAKLMGDIAACRAEILQREQALQTAQSRVMAEVVPFERKLAERFGEIFDALAGRYRDGTQKKKQRDILAELLFDLAQELEDRFAMDMEKRYTDAVGEKPIPPDQEAMFRDMAKALDDHFDRAFEAHFGTGGQDADGVFGDQVGDDPEISRQRASKSGRGKTGSRKPKAKAKPEPEAAFAGDLRALYLMLARALHPDKESDADRRAEKTAWMQKVTAAYGERNLAGLLDILARNPLQAVEPYLTQAPLNTLKGFAKRLRRELEQLRLQVMMSMADAPPSIAPMFRNGRFQEAAFKAHMAEGRKFLKILEARLARLEQPVGLAEMLQEYSRFGIEAFF